MVYINYLEWWERCKSCERASVCTLRDLNLNQRNQVSCYRPKSQDKEEEYDRCSVQCVQRKG